MSEIRNHYETILGDSYSAMLGDFEAAVEREMQSFRDDGIGAIDDSRALDLGCGSGLHSVALARLGFETTAVDFVPELLGELETRAHGLSVLTRRADIRQAEAMAGGPFELIVCMGDTLAHLGSHEDIQKLLTNSKNALAEGGRILLGFRDQTRELEGSNRILPVAQSDELLWTCFLEFSGERIRVNDILYRRTSDGSWDLSKGAYEKLRLRRDAVAELAQAAGFSVSARDAGRGFVTLSLRR